MTYTYQNLYDDVNGAVQKRLANDADPRRILNRGVRDVLLDTDIASTKRKTSSSPNLFANIFDYVWPSDGKGIAFIDLIPQIGRGKNDEWILTSAEEFDRYKGVKGNLVAILEYDGIKKLRVAVNNSNEDQLIIASLDSLLGDGALAGVGWEAFDADTTDVVADTDNFVRGTGSIRFAINAVGGLTAGIKNVSLTEFDYDDYVTLNRSVFVFAWVTSTTNLTNYKLRLGSSAAAYDEMTVTTQNDGSAFRVGWNLLRFDFSTKTTTGSPTRTAGVFAALFMTKTAGKISETGYRFDHIIAQQGRYYDIHYYSQYGWQTAAGVWIENSTVVGDYLNANPEEYNLIVEKCTEKALRDLKSYKEADVVAKSYKAMRDAYVLANPSEAKLLINTYYDL